MTNLYVNPCLLHFSRAQTFSAQYIVPKPGPIVDMTTGKQASVHQGLWSYTIGQGAKISGMPQRMFVAKKDPETNTIFVVPGAYVVPLVYLAICLVFDRDHPALFVESIRVRDFRWIWADDEPRAVSLPSGLEARVKYRHCMTDVPCTVHRWVVQTPSFDSVIDPLQRYAGVARPLSHTSEGHCPRSDCNHLC